MRGKNAAVAFSSRSIYNINVKNISKVCTGVKMVELNGIEIENKILLDGSGKIFNVDAKM